MSFKKKNNNNNTNVIRLTLDLQLIHATQDESDFEIVVINLIRLRLIRNDIYTSQTLAVPL